MYIPVKKDFHTKVGYALINEAEEVEMPETIK